MHKYASPANFQRLRRIILPAATVIALACAYLGLRGALAAPADYQQGEAVRIIYIHVPAAWMATMIYATMAVLSATFLVWRHSLADLLARSSAGIGIIFTLITLATGMLWGKPMWGAWWVWDARLTSVLVLLFLYLGYIALSSSGENEERTKVASAWLCVIGAINLPIIKFSVEWWNSLHQPASILRLGGPSIDDSMLHPLLFMIVAAFAFYIALLMLRADTAMKAQKLRRLQISRVARKNAAVEG